MLVCEAARKTLPVIPPAFEMIRDSKGRTVNHAKWMLNEIKIGNVREEKAHRWLGYAQALLICSHLLTLEKAKEINYNA
jgi:hypothetical protein